MNFSPTEPMNPYKTQKEYADFKQEQKEKNEFMDSIKEIAFSAKLQSEIAIKQSEKAEKVSISSKIKSNISFAISVLAFLTTLLTNADKIVNNIEKILINLNLL